jgi:hypothetical protein
MHWVGKAVCRRAVWHCNRTTEQKNHRVDFAGHQTAQAAHSTDNSQAGAIPLCGIAAQGAVADLVGNKGDPFLLFDLDGFALPIAHRLGPRARSSRRT